MLIMACVYSVYMVCIHLRVYLCIQVSYAGDVYMACIYLCVYLCIQVSYAGDVYMACIYLRVYLCIQVSYAGDVYRLPFGVRTVSVNSSQILVNARPFYCVGVGKHEDSDVSHRSHQSSLTVFFSVCLTVCVSVCVSVSLSFSLCLFLSVCLCVTVTLIQYLS